MRHRWPLRLLKTPPKPIAVRVTRADIEFGAPGSAAGCAIARALRRKAYGSAVAAYDPSPICVNLTRLRFDGKWYPLAPLVTKWQKQALRAQSASILASEQVKPITLILDQEQRHIFVKRALRRLTRHA